jgi:hypothetical protein
VSGKSIGNVNRANSDDEAASDDEDEDVDLNTPFDDIFAPIPWMEKAAVSLNPNPERTRQQIAATGFLQITFMVVLLCLLVNKRSRHCHSSRSERRADQSNVR